MRKDALLEKYGLIPSIANGSRSWTSAPPSRAAVPRLRRGSRGGKAACHAGVPGSARQGWKNCLSRSEGDRWCAVFEEDWYMAKANAARTCCIVMAVFAAVSFISVGKPVFHGLSDDNVPASCRRRSFLTGASTGPAYARRAALRRRDECGKSITFACTVAVAGILMAAFAGDRVCAAVQRRLAGGNAAS